jgi:hypothetical protein
MHILGTTSKTSVIRVDNEGLDGGEHRYLAALLERAVPTGERGRVI